GNINAEITTLEGCPNTQNVAKNLFQSQGFDFNMSNFITTEFSNYLLNLKTNSGIKQENYSLIYFDGNHSKKATLEYFELLLPAITNETVWIFDDIHWSKDMEEAWKIIKNHPKTTVTIDTFQWGMVFFRKEQAKEHFVIRV
ncbi:MAG TPA: class I SAM-dependent methyltransferase, partial [Flavobacterium sp.]|nr:class I SAM-dependent methyltransferase [Flavobacterium sp.]